MIRSITILLLTLAATLSAAAPPNLVVFLADDLGYGDIGCFGSDRVRTPRLDALASQGARFTQFYGPASVCSPTRTGMLSGRNPFRLGIYTYIDNRSAMHLQRSELTLPALLRENGYDTCFVGKWGANGGLTHASQPQPGDQGFDHWFASQNNAVPSHLNPTCFVRNGVPEPETKGYSSAIIVDEALGWLANRKDKTKPFCLFVWFHEPHRPIATPPDFVQSYLKFGNTPPPPTEKDAKQHPPPGTADYLGNIAHMDHQIGRVLDALESSGAAANTFTLFTSDNGPIPPGSSGGLRAGKGTLWEGGIRMPGILRWPEKVKPGRVVDDPVNGLDLLPTFCEIAGIKPPEDRVLDGESILPLLEGKAFQRRKPMFWWQMNGTVALREGDWKLHATTTPRAAKQTRTAWFQKAPLDPASVSLFNLKDDHAEATNLAAAHPEIVARLLPKLTEAHRDMQQEQQRNVPWGDDALPGGPAAKKPKPILPP